MNTSLISTNVISGDHHNACVPNPKLFFPGNLPKLTINENFATATTPVLSQ